MTEGPSLKLPGWVQRPAELTPTLDLDRPDDGQRSVDIALLQDPANEVAYKMIGGAYGVLGAEVLGHYVPRVVDPERWGIYVRDAGVAWLCRQLGPTVPDNDIRDLPHRMARAVAAHHFAHAAVEHIVSEAHGADFYLDLLVKQAPRHGWWEELLADLRFREAALSGLDADGRQLLERPLDALMARGPAPGDGAPRANVSEAVALLSSEYGLGLASEDLVASEGTRSNPCYLVIEPHLPEELASQIRRALLG